MADRYLLENSAVDGYLLEDGTGVLLLESAYASAVLSDNPISYWRFGEASGSPQDSVGTNHATAVGSPTYGATGALLGDTNTAISFSGSAQYISVPNSAVHDFTGTSSFSLEAWVNHTPDATFRRIFERRLTNEGYVVSSYSGNVIFGRYTASGNAEIFLPALTTGWHHLVFTYDGTNLRGYLDGSLAAGPTASSASITARTTPLLIGAEIGGFSTMNGSMDEPAVYSTALSLDRVLAHYNAGAAGSQTRTFTADSILKKTLSSSLTADSTLRSVVAGSVTADAVLASAPSTTYSFTFTANAILRVVVSATPTADAILSRTASATATADSILKTIVPASFLANAVFLKATSATVSADAILRSTPTSSLTSNSILRRIETSTVTADSVLRRIESRTLTADAVLLRTITASPTADAVLFKTSTSTFTANATLTTSFVGSFTADAFIAGPDEIVATFTANAVLKSAYSSTFTTDAILSRSTSVTIIADAVLHKVTAGSFTADAVLLTIVPSSFTASAVLLKTTASSPTADAILRSVVSVSVTADAFIRRIETATFTADSYLLSVVQSTLTADAVLISAPIWVSPANGATHGESPVFVFTMTASTKPMFFHLQIDTINTFNGVNLREHKSNRSQVGWEYWNGTVWVAHPDTGVPTSFVGNQARYTVQTALAQGTWYRRIRGIV